MLKAKCKFLERVFCAVAVFLRPVFDFVPMLVILVFLGALFWAKEQDPFSRRWFTLKTADGSFLKCVVVLPKPLRALPVVIYAHGSGGSLMTDGTDLRQMAELGLAVVSLEYDRTNEAAFPEEMAAVYRYLGQQKWADTNAIAWVGFSLGANWMGEVGSRQLAVGSGQWAVGGKQKAEMGTGKVGGGQLAETVRRDTRLIQAGRWGQAVPTPMALPRPRVMVLMSGIGLPEGQISGTTVRGDASPHTRDAFAPQIQSLLLVHGDQDEVFPVADTQRLAEALQTNGVPVTLRVLPGLPHDLAPDREVVFRAIGEYCLTYLGGKDAWSHYHSIAQWQAEAPPFWVFCLPAAFWAIGGGVWRWSRTLKKSGGDIGTGDRLSLPRFGPTMKRSRGEVVLRWVAALLAVCALTETALHLVPPHLAVSEQTLAIARRLLVQPKERADFEALAGRPIWGKQTLKVLLDHVELAVYNRELINWQLDDTIYRDFVLSPVISGKAEGGKRESGNGKGEKAGEELDWRRPLWEEFYPRIRHETSPEEAARIVARHLRERVTVAALSGLSHQVPEIWRNQITDETGFAIIQVAALRSVGVPARLTGAGTVEFWDGSQWQAAPAPAITGEL
jgi:acetyl esterase/lipase